MRCKNAEWLGVRFCVIAAVRLLCHCHAFFREIIGLDPIISRKAINVDSRIKCGNDMGINTRDRP